MKQYNNEKQLKEFNRKPLYTTAQILLLNNNLKNVQITTYTEEISEDGMFLVTHIDFQIDDKVYLKFNIWINNKCFPIDCQAKVTWKRKGNFEEKVLNGIWVKFDNLENEFLQIIRYYINDFTKQDLTMEL